MMRLFVYLALFQLVLLAGCEFEADVDAEDLKENPDLREEVISTFMDDNLLLTEFFDQVSQNSTAVHQMLMNHQLMEQAFGMENLEMIKEMNPETMQVLMNNMIELVQSDSSLQNEFFNHPRIQQMQGTSIVP